MPDTVNYLIGGYGVVFTIFGSLILSIWWRYRLLAADEAALAEVQKETEVHTSDKVALQAR